MNNVCKKTLRFENTYNKNNEYLTNFVDILNNKQMFSLFGIKSVV